jgi:hypothetical protein
MTNSRKPQRHLVFWAVVLAPWLLDLAAGRGVQATAFGALLWGVATVASVVYPRAQDPRLRAWLGRALLILSAAWLSYWALAFAESPRQMSISPELAQTFAWVHGGLLSAGAGMVLVLWLGAGLWLVQESSLRRSSWERRTLARIRLPSLEALSSISDGALKLAFSSWGLGLLIALITGMIRWQSRLPQNYSGGVSAPWWLDVKVLATAGLWLVLAAAFQLHISASGREQRGLYRAYYAIATVFMVAFSWFMLAGSSAVHVPLNWFLK